MYMYVHLSPIRSTSFGKKVESDEPLCGEKKEKKETTND